MTLPRFRVRTLMVAVAAVALGLGLAPLARLVLRSLEYRSRAGSHAAIARALAGRAAAGEGPVRTRRDGARAAYHAALAAKYEQAAGQPWQPVAPDPPPPP